MIKTSLYKKECSCGATGIAKLQFSKAENPQHGEWIRCSECEYPTWCIKKKS